ncbi:hypothetical protein ACN47E_000681 [Coniothyrium glycines]
MVTNEIRNLVRMAKDFFVSASKKLKNRKEGRRRAKSASPAPPPSRFRRAEEFVHCEPCRQALETPGSSLKSVPLVCHHPATDFRSARSPSL